MIRVLHGLTWTINSPSCYELTSLDRPDEARVMVRFTGWRWVVHYESPRAGIVCRPMRSRDAAMALLAARKGVEVYR